MENAVAIGEIESALAVREPKHTSLHDMEERIAATAAAGPFQLIGLFDDPSPRPQGAAQPGTPRRSAARASTANHDNSLPSGRDPLPSHQVRA
jgi:hypothetical protein